MQRPLDDDIIEQYRDPCWRPSKKQVFVSGGGSALTALPPITVTTNTLLLFVLLLIFMTTLVLGVVLCKLSQLQKSMDLFTVLVHSIN
jgi:hypothetical protein